MSSGALAMISCSVAKQARDVSASCKSWIGLRRCIADRTSKRHQGLWKTPLVRMSMKTALLRMPSSMPVCVMCVASWSYQHL